MDKLQLDNPDCVAYLKTRLSYEPATGRLVWLPLPESYVISERSRKMWNTRKVWVASGALNGKKVLNKLFSNFEDAVACRLEWQKENGFSCEHGAAHPYKEYA